ncbi:Glucose N-acetyltransferase 1 [Fulvia fulva]|nr:Glucose N-acetyltransferase 1 [Fulvia fulva]WPV15777.1 Glucose N-acetyltransferase 1 [Fulvia fulva]
MSSVILRPLAKSFGRCLLMGAALLAAFGYFRTHWTNSTSELTASVAWKDFAYVTYATDTDYLCNSLMLLESLHRLQGKADRLLLYSQEWHEDDYSIESRLLRKARDDYQAVLKPIKLQTIYTKNSERTWESSFTKLLAFNQSQYRRVLSLDSDSTLLRPMDELFLQPSAPVAMPRAYWRESDANKEIKFCNAVALIEPSSIEYQRLQREIVVQRPGDYDMDIMNRLYGSSCLELPHRPYLLLSGELGKADHKAYMGRRALPWSAEYVSAEAKYVHFSDWPLSKPWLPMQRHLRGDVRPTCEANEHDISLVDCEDQQAWDWLYQDFRQRRLNVCGPMFDKWTKIETLQEAQAKMDLS